MLQPRVVSCAPCPIAAALLMELTLCFGLPCLPEVRASCQGCRGGRGEAQGCAHLPRSGQPQHTVHSAELGVLSEEQSTFQGRRSSGDCGGPGEDPECLFLFFVRRASFD